MRKQPTRMPESLRDIAEYASKAKARLRDIAEEKHALKIESLRMRDEARQHQQHIVSDLLHAFLETMQIPEELIAYTTLGSGFAHPFTKYVKRDLNSYGYWQNEDFSPEHAKAVAAFKEAYANLNSTFVQELEMNACFRERVIRSSSLRLGEGV